MKKILNYLPIIFVILTIIVLYNQVLDFDYLWDDDLLIVDNVALLNSNLSWDLIARPVLDGSSYFRPLVFFSWFLEFKIWGQSSFISHVINLIIFCFNTILFYFLTNFILNLDHKQKAILPAICAFIYAVHPIQVETVAWVSGRFDLLMTFFALSACLLFLYRQIKNIKSLQLDVFIPICFLLSMLSKETGILIPIILVLLNFLINKEKGFFASIYSLFQSDKRLCFMIISTLAVYFILRVYSIESVYHVKLNFNYYEKVVFEDYTPIFSIKEYLVHALLPFFNLGPMQPTELFIKKNFLNLISIIFVLIFLIFIFYLSIIKKNTSSLMILIYLSSISLVVFFIPILSGNNIIQERFMTLGIGFFILSVIIFCLNLKNRKIKLLLTSLIVLWSFCLAITTKSILPFWKNELTLWSWVYKSYPEVPVIRNLYFYSLVKHGEHDYLISLVDDNYIKKGKSLHVADQIIFARALLTKGNPESIHYLNSVIEMLPKFHEDKINMKDLVMLTANYQLNPMIFATAYDSLSIATLWFENNPQRALDYNKIAEYYLDEEEKYPLLYNRLAILKIMGLDNEYNILSSDIYNINMYKKRENIENYYKIIEKWCLYNEPKFCRNY